MTSCARFLRAAAACAVLAMAPMAHAAITGPGRTDALPTGNQAQRCWPITRSTPSIAPAATICEAPPGSARWRCEPPWARAAPG